MSYYESLTRGDTGYGSGLDSMYTNTFEPITFDTSSAYDTYIPTYTAYDSTSSWLDGLRDFGVYDNIGYNDFADFGTDFGFSDYSSGYDFGIDDYTDSDWDDITGMANNLGLSEDDNIVATFNDLSEIGGGTEIESLELAGVDIYDSDGNIKDDLDTNTVIAKLEAAVLDTENDLTHEQRNDLTQTRNEIVAAVEGGVDSITIADDGYRQDDYHVHQYNDMMYKNPTVVKGGNNARMPMLGSYIKRNQNYNPPVDDNTQYSAGSLVGGKKGYSFVPGNVTGNTNPGEIGPGYVSPDGKFVMTDAMAASMDPSNSYIITGDGYKDVGATRLGQTAALAEARRDVANEMGKPNLFDRSGQLIEPRKGFNDHFDSFTDTLGNVATTILSPLNFVTDKVGGGVRAVGSALGDNFIGRGVQNLGGFIDGTGDFVFNQVPDTVINYPDNAVNMLTGAGRELFGVDMGIGQPSNTSLMMGGLKGLFTDPLVLAGDALSFPLSMGVDVLGIDELSFGSKSGGGGGGGKSSKKKKSSRKNVPLVKGTGKMKSDGTGGTPSGGPQTAGGSTVSVGEGNYDLGTKEGQQQYVDDTGSYEALMEALNRVGEDYLLGDGIEGKDAPFKASSADTSSIKNAAMANQGNVGIRRTAPQNAIDVYAGKEDPDAINADANRSVGDVFKNPPMVDQGKMVPDQEEDEEN